MEDTSFARFYHKKSLNVDILPILRISPLLRLLLIAVRPEAVSDGRLEHRRSNKMTTRFLAGWCKEVQMVDKCYK